MEKLCKIWENIGILNFQEQREKENIWCQNQIIILITIVFHRKFTSNRNEKNSNTLSILDLSKTAMYDVETKLDTSSFEIERQLPKRKKQKRQLD